MYFHGYNQYEAIKTDYCFYSVSMYFHGYNRYEAIKTELYLYRFFALVFLEKYLFLTNSQTNDKSPAFLLTVRSVDVVRYLPC